ncbi:DUF3541 domain-containing protein [Vibrio sp. SCSIO 43140]|uniref:DUF3541 domain-containing protein n=1 Tax=Vibrio sp. SCSIO 43140 TaxID=2819100 RepID=UPI00207618A3|nr:DUF3541 domain-containing protein [Vibrio sp. SCSIO 43140]USD63222.1 DUF3541 domain-containing protein [Vibrio sp. SCSIO 43140]
MILKKRILALTVSAFLITGASIIDFSSTPKPHQLQAHANVVKDTYESRLFSLSPYKQGHFGLRMYRQTQDTKYKTTILVDLANVTDRLNHIAANVNTPDAIHQHSLERLNEYKKGKDERSVRRYKATKDQPEYFYMGLDVLRYLARLQEYGVTHKDDKKLRKLLRSYDFESVLTDKEMITAWAAQLANQAYWLKQIGEQDLVDEFITAFKKTYPSSEDYRLSKQQFGNKLYGMTHIILADSGYYQRQVSEQEHQWIYDYFRRNIDDIIKHTKEDIIAEVGISFLLAGLEDDPVVAKTRAAITKSIDKRHGMIPSVSGDFDFAYGEHRNVLAIMLLDWQPPYEGPNVKTDPKLFKQLPYGVSI